MRICLNSVINYLQIFNTRWQKTILSRCVVSWTTTITYVVHEPTKLFHKKALNTNQPIQNCDVISHAWLQFSGRLAKYLLRLWHGSINTYLLCVCTYHIEAKTNGRHFPDDIFKSIFLNENGLISIKISLKIVPKGQINNIPALV